MSNFFDDPFGNKSAANSAREFFGLGSEMPGMKTADYVYGRDPEGEMETLDIRKGENDGGKLTTLETPTGPAKPDEEDVDSVPMGAKQQWLGALMRGLPNAIAVAISKDPGKALLSVMQSRQDYEIESERRQERASREEARKSEAAKAFEQKDEEIEEIKRRNRAQEDFNKQRERDYLRLQELLEGGRNDRAQATNEIRRLEATNRVAIALSSDANQLMIAQTNQANNLAINKFNATMRANTALEVRRMIEKGTIDQWRREGTTALALAGARHGDPQATQNAQSVMAKIEKSGKDALTEEEMQLVQWSQEMDGGQSMDETRKQLLDVAAKSALAGQKTQYIKDAYGNTQVIAGKSGAELTAFVGDAVQAVMQNSGAQGAFVLPGGNPAMGRDAEQQKFLETMKLNIKGLEPAEAFKQALYAKEQGFISEDMWISLGLRDPNEEVTSSTGDNFQRFNNPDRKTGGAMSNFAPPTAP